MIRRILNLFKRKSHSTFTQYCYNLENQHTLMLHFEIDQDPFHELPTSIFSEWVILDDKGFPETRFSLTERQCADLADTLYNYVKKSQDRRSTL